MRRMLPRRAAAAFVGLASLLAPAALADGPSRDEAPVLVTGALLSRFSREPVGRIAVFRWNPATAAFDPIPFQLDQRVDEVFNPGTPFAFVQRIYDVLGHDDGLLDDDDELAFLFGDAGPRAPGDAPWVEGAEDSRLEVQVTSALPGQTPVTRWAYVYAGDALPLSGASYVQWNGQPDGAVVTPVMTVGYAGPWLLTALSIAPPCGDGADLIDRVKGRAVTQVANEEDEENWNLNSTFLGALVGPIRAIRYVRGATSALNTIHDDVIYRASWVREAELRVHALQSASLYIDWRPLAQGRFYSPSAMAGVPVDGAPDPVSSAYVAWTLTASQDGGLAVVHEVVPGPLYQTRSAIYRDDASYDDAVPGDPGYPDDDDSAYGASGVKLSGVSETGVQAITIWSVAYALCAGVGDGATGTAYRQFFDDPLQIVTIPQQRRLGPVTTLTCARDGGDVVLAWQAIPGATSYEVYSCDQPGAPRDSWTLLGETAAPGWRDAGAVGKPSEFYGVVAVGPDGEGEW